MSKPPEWAQRFVEWYCKPELAEDLLGDLNEYFDRNVESKGLFRAKLVYAMDAIKFCRLYTVRRPVFINLIISWIMIGSYIKTSSRSLMRSKLFSFINVVGLAIGMSVGLLMISFIHDIVSYDTFHEKRDRIYRVNTRFEFPEKGMAEFATMSAKAAKLIQDKVPGIEASTHMQRDLRGDAVVENLTIPLSGFWADASFFDVFTFPLVQGDARTALKDPYSLVLTERSARKLFGDGEALGKVIRFMDSDYRINGVIKDIPRFSHMQFEALASLSTVEPGWKDDPDFMSWSASWFTYLYVVADENADTRDIQMRIDAIAREENAHEDFKREFTLQPLPDIVLSDNVSNSIGPRISYSMVWIIGGLAFVVIISACFNYTNLSIARSIRRFKEIGLRKVIGAGRTHVRQQFIYEAVIVSLAALILSFGLFLLLRNEFLGSYRDIGRVATLELTPIIIGSFIVFSIAVGILAGFLPALFFSRIGIIQALKDPSSVRFFKHLSIRRALVIVQYTLTLMFITATIIGYTQYKSFLAFNLGFDTENIFNIRQQGQSSEVLLKEFRELPEVEGTSRSSVVSSVGNYSGDYVKYKVMNDSSMTWRNMIDENYLSMHAHQFIAGGNFIARPTTKAADSEVIVNETLVKTFNVAGGDPLKAVGEEIFADGQRLTIVGVVKDFHYGTVENRVEPVVFRYWLDDGDGYINLKLHTLDPVETRAKIEAIWKRLDPVHPLDGEFHDESIRRAYSGFSGMIRIVGFLSFLAISIASLGLFGMVVFTTETRLKEISIRKVMGASAGNLIVLLSRGFVGLLCISAAIALPATYVVFENIVLSSFPFHTPVGIWELFVGLGGVLIIAFIMIGSQTLKAARSNPAQVLKNE